MKKQGHGDRIASLHLAAGLLLFACLSAWAIDGRPALAQSLPIATPVPAGLGHAANAAAFATLPIDLRSAGYVEREYLVSGTAQVYGYNHPVGWDDSVTVLRRGPYVSRMLIRAPSDRAKFSGNVVVELFNDVLAGDQATAFPQAGAHFLRNGDIWVAITSNATGIADLRSFNPERYAALSWASPDPHRNATSCPGDPTATVENGFVYDIVSQTAALLRSPSAANPLHGYDVKALYAAGYSGSGEILLTYLRAIEPTLPTAPFDGYMVAAGGLREALNQCSTAAELVSHDLVPRSARAAVFQVQTPSEVILYRALALGSAFPQQWDSDLPDNRYRFYEIAGTSHVDQTLIDGAPNDADQLVTFGGTIDELTAGCKQSAPVSRFPDRYVYDNLWARLEEWVRSGRPPPHALPVLGVDLLGNDIGGVRSVAVDVPIASYLPGSYLPFLSTLETITLPCPFLGRSVDLSPSQLRFLYGNKTSYMQRVATDAQNLVRAGFFEAADMQPLIDASVRIAIP